MLNFALRTLDVEVILKMGFFLKDLHQQIEQLYEETEISCSFHVYRDQG